MYVFRGSISQQSFFQKDKMNLLLHRKMVSSGLVYNLEKKISSPKLVLCNAWFSTTDHLQDVKKQSLLFLQTTRKSAQLLPAVNACQPT